MGNAVVSTLFPNRKIHIIDSKAASMGLGLLVYQAAKMRKDERDIEYVTNWVERNALRVCHWFTVDDLMHLNQGGRLSSSNLFFGKLFHVKPILSVDTKGRIKSASKAFGRYNSLNKLIKIAKENIVNPTEQTIFISHADCMLDAESVAEVLKRELNVKDVKINYMGSIIGTHVGPGSIGIFYFGNERYFDYT